MCKAHSNTRHGNLRLTTDSCGCASSAHSAFCVIKNSYYTKKTSYSFVGSPMPATGIEPVWEYKSRRILSPVASCQLRATPALWYILIHNPNLVQPKLHFTACKPVLCRMGGEGFEPSKAVPADLQSVPFGHSGIHP